MINETTPSREELVAMAVAVIAEELGTDVQHVRVCSFREIKKSGLAQYLEDNNISYTKYELRV